MSKYRQKIHNTSRDKKHFSYTADKAHYKNQTIKNKGNSDYVKRGGQRF